MTSHSEALITLRQPPPAVCLRERVFLEYVEVVAQAGAELGGKPFQIRCIEVVPSPEGLGQKIVHIPPIGITGTGDYLPPPSETGSPAPYTGSFASAAGSEARRH